MPLHTLSCEDAISFCCEAAWGFAEIDPDGKFVWINPAFCDILNAPADLVIDTNYKTWTHPEDLEIDSNLANKTRSGDIPGYTLAKRYLQRGSTPTNPRVIWGILSVSGKWSETKEFLGYRVQYRPYDAIPPQKIQWVEAVKWGVQNWKTILTILAVLMSLTSIGSEKLMSALKKAKDTADSVNSALDSSSVGP